MQIYIAGVCFCNFSLFKCLSESPAPLIAEPVMRRWCEHGGGSWLQPFPPLSFFLHCLARPLAATIDPQVELMTKLTNPWGVRVREIKRKMEWKRPRPAHCTPSSPPPVRRGRFCTPCRDAKFMQYEGFFFRAGGDPGGPSETLAWSERRWQVMLPRQRSSATDQTGAVCSSSGRPGTVQRAWSRVGTDHSANHWSRANCATREAGWGGGTRSERAWRQYLLCLLQSNTKIYPGPPVGICFFTFS